MRIKILEYGGKLNSFLFSRSKDRFKTVLLWVYGLYGPLRALRARPTGPYGLRALRALRAHGPYGPPTGLRALRALRALTRIWTMTTPPGQKYLFNDTLQHNKIDKSPYSYSLTKTNKTNYKMGPYKLYVEL